MIQLDAPGAVRWICRTLEEAGYDTWVVGGAVRNRVAGRKAGDWDLTTRARPEQVRSLFRRTVPIGIDHGTVGVLARDGTLYEVTTFRRDIETTGRHAVVAFADTLDEDLSRRDFTINAIAWHPLRGLLHDPHGGASDLRDSVLRTVGDPESRFAEDYLRVPRALRFAGTFRLDVEPRTWVALVRAIPRTGDLSPERIREEMDKILGSEAPPSCALSLYAASGALAFLYPELDELVAASAVADGDVWARTLRTVDVLGARDPELRWAALLGGTGSGEGGDRAAAAAAVLVRLRSSNARIDRVVRTVEWSGKRPVEPATEADLRRWMAGAGRGRLPDLARIWVARARADAVRRRASPGGGQGEGYGDLPRLLRRLRSLSRSAVPLSVEELEFSGRDLIRSGYKPGPSFGEVLRHLLDFVLEDPARNERAALTHEALRWLDARGADGKASRKGNDG